MNISDLSPDALSKLEAKLLADVEVVRRMRVLMEEHQGLLRKAGPAPVLPVVPAPPRKSWEEAALEVLGELPLEGFVVDDLRSRLRKAGYTPDDAGLKTLMNRWIRQGKVCVHQLKKGRGGSIYRSTMPRAEASISPENEGAPSVSGPPPAVS